MRYIYASNHIGRVVGLLHGIYAKDIAEEGGDKG
jgi:hypothetical protein